ncbi:hypothetical protein DFP92_102398 [Yoonia sediminilitoris]|uniref:Baseplate J-like protein n=1 Tax=Yoonia sediminilitoris TaxID=1286148 RepID=A0A2T6KMF2_9RHOB|nr:hypothetical protein C8N45_102398 [Yoonia sediminilitoris]RCW97681.1 hypothetical protein DFP92_102398 [Yoonia sediminilitoris]
MAAQVISFRQDDEVTRFRCAMEQGQEAAANLVRFLAAKLDDWLSRMTSQHKASLAEPIAALDTQMSLTTKVGKLADASISRMPEVVKAQGFLPAQGEAASTAYRIGLNAAHRQLLHTIASLQPLAKIAFENRLASHELDPAIGLIIAELTMSLEVEKHVNYFGARHRAFYYGDLIGQDLRGAAPERALLHLPSGAVLQKVPKGTGIVAQLDDGRKVRFQTETEVAVTPAKVGATAALTYTTNMKNSLASSLGAITGMHAIIDPAGPLSPGRRVFNAPPEAPFDVGIDIASEMFAVAEGHRTINLALYMDRATDLPAASYPQDIAPDAIPDPRIALELRADPALVATLDFPSRIKAIEFIARRVNQLAKERNCIPSMDLIYEVISRELVQRGNKSAQSLRTLLGRVLTLALIENRAWPTGAYWTALEAGITKHKAALMGQRKPKSDDQKQIGEIIEAFTVVKGKFAYEPAEIFQKLLGDAFTITLSTETGPVTATTTIIKPLDALTSQTVAKRKKSTAAGIGVQLIFAPEKPALTPPPDGSAAAPVMNIRWNQSGRACPITFFERYMLDAIGITINVKGVSQVSAFSDDGLLATAQSFLPFGARPKDAATFTVSAPEIVSKPVTSIAMAIEWADLPTTPGGFAGHYETYPDTVVIPEPKVQTAYLAPDGWKPDREEPLPLFESRAHDGLLHDRWQVRINIPGITFPPLPRQDAKPLKSRNNVKPGAIRLKLQDAGDFGQAAYPLALVNAMRPRWVPGLRPRKIPPAPYIPKISKLRLDYTASATMDLAATETARPGDQVTQITPFGHRVAFPRKIHRDFGLFPKRLGLASLYVQLTGAGSKKRLGLLFDIADSGHQRIAPDVVGIHWHYLTAQGWKTLPETVIFSDTTDGLTKSGVVILDLPDDADTPKGEFPDGGVWVAASTDSPHFATHPVLSQVRTNGVWAQRAVGNDDHADGPRSWKFETPISGLAAPVEASRRAPPRAAESAPHYLARVSERLRHRKRAVTPFDVERLVLEKFPEVWIAKCLPHLTRATPEPCPGTTTVVITRHPPEVMTSSPEGRLFDPGTLNKVQKYLQSHGAEGVQYEVVNPAFDRIHVRAAVRFSPFLDDGAMAHKLRLYLAQVLSVWTAKDSLGQFGWQLQEPVLRAQIAALDYVEDVTDFSVLHFMVDDTPHYRLADTAHWAGGPDHVIRPSRPWALALSASDHAISTLETPQNIPATPSGIGRLRVGDMLIVSEEARQ